MPTYEYAAADPARSCPRCADGFEIARSLRDAPLSACPVCGAPLRKCPAAPAIGRSRAALDQRAKAAGFRKLKRLGRGEYEQLY